jgi:hypothetical protein
MFARAISSLWKRWQSTGTAFHALTIAGIGMAISLLTAQFLPASGGASGPGNLAAVVLQGFLPCLGVLLAGWAITRSPQSVAVIGSAAFLTALAARAVAPALDTIRLAFLVASVVAACAALILLLPASLRRLTVSLLILFHFCGIFCAVLAAPPPGTAPPWLTSQIWTRLFRPYLQFVYLNNAYHFYSPEPGPATLLWFRIEAVDGTARWKKIPSLADARDPLLIEYYRRLSLTENASQLATIQNVPPEIARRRAVASVVDAIPSAEEIAVEAPGIIQYRPLAPNSRRFIESYVRHVAHADAPGGRVENIKNIKVYRIVHSIIHPGLLATGKKPGDHTLYAPFYEGTFDADGKLVNLNDPYLDWLIPVFGPKANMPQPYQSGRDANAGSATKTDRDYFTIHAGSSPWEEDQ